MALVMSLWGKESRRCRGGVVVILAAADAVHDQTSASIACIPASIAQIVYQIEVLS